MSSLPQPPPAIEMKPGVSVTARFSLLIACLAIILALQYPLFLSYFQRLTSSGPVVTGVGVDRSKVLAALSGLSQYKIKANAALHKKKREYNKLPSQQKLHLLQSLKYYTKISQATAAANTNDRVAKAVRDFGMRYYNISSLELHAYEKTRGRASGDHTQVVQALKHFVRDWSSAGEHERSATFPPILTTMKTLFPNQLREGRQTRVLVPGAGLGRLAYELAAQGFDVVANEFSPYMTLAHRYILSLHQENPIAKIDGHTFHPNINWWSHHRSNESMLRAATFPEVLPQRDVLNRLRLIEGDFVKAFLPLEESGFDAVVTLFFIDTARNIVDYLETIHKVLKPGGIWANLGPLLYGTAPLIELSLDEVLRVAEKIGFELLPVDEKWGDDTFPDVEEWKGKIKGNLAGYSWDQESLSRNAYQAQFWVGRKKD
ncbi:putative trehalase [Sphaerosporella brunnea]|uniref:Putative trehalase n=1 Tax=Sphaerosporella brunnea TaxID=1250544 RepID=A0A5J5EUC4_9PEZI|nr:putative trehalase [Sphaerosporella brunnea]